MGNEGFWSRTRRIALEVVTTGGTRKFDVLRQEAQEADERLRAACREYEQLEVRMKFLAVSRGAANQLAHLRLVEVTEVVQKFGNARAVQVLTLSDQSCPAIAKMQKTIVDFNVAVELITGSGAGIATTAGAWAAVSGLGVASTGTAISGLSGAAATHATLAWFGGGSLVTGGGGMALGSCVIGGLVMVPMIGVAAWLTHRSADKKRAEIQPKIELTKSETARLDQIVRVMSAECHRIESLTLRTNELAGALKKTLQELQGNVQSKLPE